MPGGKSKATPMMRQFYSVKAEYPDTVLFFRMGDFFEMFGEDARIASEILNITLTSRDGKAENAIPLCGFPHFALPGYLRKMVEAGHKVAICDQTEDPKQAKGLVKREVVRVVTPGTVIEDEILDGDRTAWLAAAFLSDKLAVLAACDAGSGRFVVTQFEGAKRKRALATEIERLQPRELLVDIEQSGEIESLLNGGEIPLSPREESTAPPVEHIARAFPRQGGDHEVFGAKEARSAIRLILDYLDYSFPALKKNLRRVQGYRTGDLLYMDAITQRNLELERTMRDRSKKNSLLSVIDHTRTPMGARLLREWVTGPLKDPRRISRRQDGVEELVNSARLREELKETLRGVRDMERLSGRTVSSAANARDLVALKESLNAAGELKQLMGGLKSTVLSGIASALDPLPELSELLANALVDDPPLALADGGMIRTGYNEELDEFRRISKEGNSWIAGEEARFREETGIPKLKVGFNKVFGYYLEVGKAHQDKVPEHFIKKQTLVNADRYFTPELKEMEEKILSAEGRAKALERTLFEEVREKVAAEADAISLNGRSVAALDALYSLSEAAFLGDYVRPVVDDSRALVIEGGRHPVLEKLAGSGNFIPNDLTLDLDEKHLAILTGPNMAGKSTYMRQAALIAILAQIGSFVPAKAARIGAIDRIFTRVGATDDLALGQSTFMVEMVEAARILSGATPESLVILDEIGRGTSTFDGMSLAWAIAEELHNNPDIRCRALFATHYHELTQLSGFLPGVSNLRVDLKEVGGEIVFLHKVREGEARKSYGIQVAKLAGLPDSVLERAGEILGQLEKERHLFEIEGKAPDEPEAEDEARQETEPVSDKEEKKDGDSQQLGLFG